MPPQILQAKLHSKLLECIGDDPAQDTDLAVVEDDSEELAKLMDCSGSSSQSTDEKGQLPVRVVHPSRGSEKHHSGNCQPCSFYLRGKCTVAEGCLYCHYEHDRPQRPGKKSRERAKRRIANAKASEPESGMVYAGEAMNSGYRGPGHGFGGIGQILDSVQDILERDESLLPALTQLPRPDAARRDARVDPLRHLPDPPPGVIRL
ncbi:Hypothetical protein (Fragment) [Durusdinium trenchii]|uniref:C3H1-type domain-containing protein n=1 Tax=Durusdinium trenchii TaxID=1381693 RepID=A0ABP0RUN5_9DINO